MANPVTIDDIVPLIAALTPLERARLVRLIVSPQGGEDASLYHAMPPAPDEFSSDEDPLAWEASDWEPAD